ncbi:MAG: HAD family hydrolase [Patescibacteria group bacterium]
MKKNKVRAVIYDFDGTIIHSLPLHLEAYRYALLQSNVRISDRDIIKHCFNKSHEEAASSLRIDDTAALTKNHHDMLSKNLHSFNLEMNIEATLDELKKRRVRIFIGSLGLSDRINSILKRFNLTDTFDAIAGYDNSFKAKDEIFSVLISKNHLNPEHVLVVGDAENDIRGAKTIGATSVLYHPDEHEKFYALKNLKELMPDYIITDHLEILNILNS